MKRQISSFRAVICLLVCTISGALAYFMLANAARSGVIAELVVGLLAAVFGLLACWMLLATSPRVDLNDKLVSSETDNWGDQQSTELDKPRRDINVRMALSATVLLFSFVAGTIWVAFSMFGTPRMLFLGWSWILFFAIVAITGIWISGPNR